MVLLRALPPFPQQRALWRRTPSRRRGHGRYPVAGGDGTGRPAWYRVPSSLTASAPRSSPPAPSVTQRARATHARHAVHVAYDAGGTTGRRLSAFGLPSGRADAPLGRPAARAGAGAGPLRSSRLARLCWVGWCGKGGRGSPTLYVRLLWVPRDGRGRRGVRYADRPESVRESTQSTRGLVICSDPNWPALRQSRCAESRCRYALGVSPSPGADVCGKE